MKILHVSDLHFRMPWFEWLELAAPSYDCVVFSGDALDIFRSFTGYPHDTLSLQKQAGWLNRYFDQFPAPLFFASGNHEIDSKLKTANPLVRLDGTNQVIQGLRFICHPWAGPATWPPSSEPVVLIAHAPPDGLAIAQGDTGDVGDFAVRVIAETLPDGSLVMSGHTHTNEAWIEVIYAGSAGASKITCLNAGVDFEAQIPNHIIVDTERRWAERVTESSGRSRLRLG